MGSRVCGILDSAIALVSEIMGGLEGENVPCQFNELLDILKNGEKHITGKMEMLESELGKCRDENDDLVKEVGRLRKDERKWSDRVKKADDRYASFIEERSRIVEERNKVVSDLEKKVKVLEDLIRDRECWVGVWKEKLLNLCDETKTESKVHRLEAQKLADQHIIEELRQGKLEAHRRLEELRCQCTLTTDELKRQVLDAKLEKMRFRESMEDMKRRVSKADKVVEEMSRKELELRNRLLAAEFDKSEELRCVKLEVSGIMEKLRRQVVAANLDKMKFQESMEGMKVRLSDADETVEELRCQNINMSNATAELRNRLLAADVEKVRSDKILQEMSQKQMEADQTVKELRQHNTDASNIIEELKDHVFVAEVDKSQSDEIIKEMSQKQLEADQLAQGLKRPNSERSNVVDESKNRLLAAELDKLEELRRKELEVSEIKKKLSHQVLAANLDKMMCENEVMKRRMAEADKIVGERNRSIFVLKKKVNELENQIRDRDYEVGVWKEKLKLSDDKVAKTESEVHRFKAQKVAAHKIIEELRQGKLEGQRRLEELRCQCSGITMELRRQVLAANTDKRRFEKSMEGMKCRVSEADMILEERNKVISELKKKVNEIENQIRDGDYTEGVCPEILKLSDDKVAKTELEVHNLKAQKLAAHKIIEDLVQVQLEVDRRLEELICQASGITKKFRRQVFTANSDKMNFEKSVEGMRSRLSEADKSINGLKHELESAKALTGLDRLKILDELQKSHKAFEDMKEKCVLLENAKGLVEIERLKIQDELQKSRKVCGNLKEKCILLESDKVLVEMTNQHAATGLLKTGSRYFPLQLPSDNAGSPHQACADSSYNHQPKTNSKDRERETKKLQGSASDPIEVIDDSDDEAGRRQSAKNFELPSLNQPVSPKTAPCQDQDPKDETQKPEDGSLQEIATAGVPVVANAVSGAFLTFNASGLQKTGSRAFPPKLSRDSMGNLYQSSVGFYNPQAKTNSKDRERESKKVQGSASDPIEVLDDSDDEAGRGQSAKNSDSCANLGETTIKVFELPSPSHSAPVTSVIPRKRGSLEMKDCNSPNDGQNKKRSQKPTHETVKPSDDDMAGSSRSKPMTQSVSTSFITRKRGSLEMNDGNSSDYGQNKKRIQMPTHGTDKSSSDDMPGSSRSKPMTQSVSTLLNNPVLKQCEQRGFILCDSNSDDEDSTDSEYDSCSESCVNAIIAGIRSKKLQKEWLSRSEMLNDFQQDVAHCMNALCVLFRKKMSGPSSVDLDKRLAHFDALGGCDMAKYLINGDPQNRLAKSVAEVKQENPAVIDRCRRLALDYFEVLFSIYSNGEDPFFRPR